MGVRRPGQVVGGRPDVDSQGPLGDQVGRVRSHEMNAQHRTAARFADQLHQSIHLAQDSRSWIGRERELRDLHVSSLVARRCFGQAHAGNLGAREDDVRNRAIVHRATAAAGVLSGHAPVDHRLVRQHRAADRVSDRPHVWHAGRQVLVHGDRPTVHRHADLGQAETLGVRPASRGDQDAIALDSRQDALRVATRRGQAASGGHDLLDVRFGDDAHAPPPEQECQALRQRFVGPPRQQGRHHLQDRHLAAQGFVDAGELEADDASPDHDQASRDVRDVERLGAGDHARQVQAGNRRPGGDGPRGEDHAAGRHAHRIASVGLHAKGVWRRQVARAAQQGDTRSLQQVLNPAHQGVHGTLLVLHEGGQVRVGRRDGKAELARAPRRQQQLCRCGQGLGGNAADVQARAPHPLSLDQHRPCAELRRSKRSDVTARATTQHGQVEAAAHHDPG